MTTTGQESPQGAKTDKQRSGIGTPTMRIDGRAKVTGEARYGSDFDGGRQPAHAALATSRIARGRITRLDDTAARQVPGVIEILTYRNVGDRIRPGRLYSAKGSMGSSMAPLRSNQIWYNGQIVALVVADTFEAAREAADRIVVEYAEERPSSSFDSPGTTMKPVLDGMAIVGNAEDAFATTPVKIDARYETPTQHHNPIELFTTTCSWSDVKLTVWESSQGVYRFQNGLAEQLGLDPADVRVISPFAGGGFGFRGTLSQSTAIVALASKMVGRPVRLEATRMQCFTITTYRAETRHRVRVAAEADGKLKALILEGWEVTSRGDDYKIAGMNSTSRLYACPNVATKCTIINADRNTPGFMRAPELPYTFALESAMDELAVSLGMDPIELRRVNDTMHEPIKGLPFTSRALMPCFDAAAKAFGWAKRTPKPRSMRDGDWLVGLGCASSMYPTNMAPAAVRVTLRARGSVRVQTAGHEIGNGAYTALALTAAQELGVWLDDVSVELGDTDLPPAPVAGGSNSTASVCTVVAKACEQIRDRLAAAAVAAENSPFHGTDPKTIRLQDGALQNSEGRSEPLKAAIDRIGGGAVEAYAENLPHGVPPEAMEALYRGLPTLTGGPRLKDRIQYAFGAQFAEVRVHALTGEVRVPRLVGAYAAGRIVNPMAAKSQIMGGQIWGMSAALHEGTEIDARQARYVNADLGEYLIPVNADITHVETILLPEEDHLVNKLGIKGIGELGNNGQDAAVANAVFHATGLRIRKLPIRIENFMSPGAVAIDSM